MEINLNFTDIIEYIGNNSLSSFEIKEILDKLETELDFDNIIEYLNFNSISSSQRKQILNQIGDFEFSDVLNYLKNESTESEDKEILQLLSSSDDNSNNSNNSTLYNESKNEIILNLKQLSLEQLQQIEIQNIPMGKRVGSL